MSSECPSTRARPKVCKQTSAVSDKPTAVLMPAMHRHPCQKGNTFTLVGWSLTVSKEDTYTRHSPNFPLTRVASVHQNFPLPPSKQTIRRTAPESHASFHINTSLHDEQLHHQYLRPPSHQPGTTNACGRPQTANQKFRLSNTSHHMRRPTSQHKTRLRPA